MSAGQRRRLGILGGMGPLATVDLVEKIVRLTPAADDQEHVPLVIWSDPQVPPRSAAILARGASPLPAMQAGLRALESAGAGAVAIACNTAHHWFDELARDSGCELLHIADAVAAELERRTPRARRIGLLATAGTIAAGFYQRRLGERGFEILVPAAPVQEQIATGIDAVKAGRVADGRAPLADAVATLVADGAEAVALACTEIPIALRDAPDELRRLCLDATEALARRCVEWATQSVPISGSSRAAASSARARP